MRTILLIFLLATITSCGQTSDKKQQNKTRKASSPVEVKKTKEGDKKAYFASGCFWCTESIYKSVIGVKKVIPGYSGGKGKNPTYENYSRKGHTETVEVTYNPSVIDFNTLLTVYFGSQNVIQQNGQGPDKGTGYRSVVFYQNAAEQKTIRKKIKKLQKKHKRPVAAKVVPFQKFWEAEDYHQNYDEKHPNNPYVRNVSLPRLYQFQNKYPELLKNKD